MTVLVGLVTLVRHPFLASHRGTFGDENHRVLAGMTAAVVRHQLGEVLGLEGILRDHATVGGTSHRGEQRGKAGVTPEYLYDEKPLVRASRRPQLMRELDGPRDACTEADAVIGARDIVVHRLGHRHHRNTEFV